MKIDLRETHLHYIGLFGGLGLLMLFAFGGWHLSETSEWFRNIWDQTDYRLLIIFGFPAITLWAFSFVYSYFWGRRKFIRTFKEVKKSNLVNCNDDEVVRIQGTLIVMGESLVAPFSDKQCAAYETRALCEEDVVTAKGSGSHVESKTIWETIKVVKEVSDFLIKCGEQYALVRVKDAQIKIHEDITHDDSNYKKDRGGFLTEQENEKRKNALEKMGLSPRNYVGVYAANIKFEEGILEPDEQVAVLGKGKWVDTSGIEELQFLVEQGVSKIFEIKNDAKSELHISDSIDVLDNHVGKKW